MRSDQQTIQALILASAGSDARLDETIRSIGQERVAEILIDELVSRADLEDLVGITERSTTVRFTLVGDGSATSHTVQIGPAGIMHGAVDDESPNASIELVMAELARAVYGPRPGAGPIHQRVSWRDIESPETLARGMQVVPVVRRLLRGTREQPVDLAELALRFGSDKWGPLHDYAPHYTRHFGPLRDRPLVLVELGIGGYDLAPGGGSLRMWKRFLPRAVIYGVDIVDKKEVAEQRIIPVQGDQADPAFLATLVAGTGPVDIVVDDGSHVCSDVISAFHALFPHVRPGGLYVIEDLQTSYWPGYGGSSHTLDDPNTTVGFLKQLLDGLHHVEFEPPGIRRPSGTDLTVVGVHFYHNLVVIEKGANVEERAPDWVGRTPMPLTVR